MTQRSSRHDAAAQSRRFGDAEDERVVRVALTVEGQKLRGKASGIPSEIACRTFSAHRK